MRNRDPHERIQVFHTRQPSGIDRLSRVRRECTINLRTQPPETLWITEQLVDSIRQRRRRAVRACDDGYDCAPQNERRRGRVGVHLTFLILRPSSDTRMVKYE